MESATHVHIYRRILSAAVGVLLLGLTTSALPRHQRGLRDRKPAAESSPTTNGLFAIVKGRSRRDASLPPTTSQSQQAQSRPQTGCRLRHMHRFGEVEITYPGCQPKQHVIPVCQGGCLSWAKPVYQSASFQMRRKCCIPTDFKLVKVVLDCRHTQSGEAWHKSITVHHPTSCDCR